MPSAKFPTILSLAAGQHQLPLIRAAQERGFKVVAIDRNPDAAGMHLADVALELSTHDGPAIRAALVRLQPKYDFRGIVHRTSGKALETAAMLSGEFGLRGLCSQAARISTEKSALREFCAKNGIPMPRGFSCRGDAKLPLELPVIVKPDFPTVGKRDVRRIAHQRDLAAAMRAAAASSFNQMVEVEQYIDGIDVSCLFWLDRAQATIITTYDELIGVAEAGTLLPFGISMPSSIMGHAWQAGLTRVVDGLAAALPEVSALMIVSMRVDREGRPHVIELHADLGGDRIAEELFPRAMPELNFFDLAVRLASGGTLPEFKACHGAHMLLYAGYEGRLGEAGLESELLSADHIEANLERLAESVSRCLQPVALAPRQISSWAPALGDWA